MYKKIKERLVYTPGLGHALRVAKNVYRLPEINIQQHTLKESVGQLYQQNQELLKQIEELRALLKKLGLNQDNTNRQLNLIAATPTSAKNDAKPQSDSDNLFADDHILDNFYTDFEDKFRGTEEMVSKRLEDYLPYFKDSSIDFKQKPVLDIGCGRGEFLSLMKTNKISALGLDINLDMVKRAKKKGLDAVQGDAIVHLQEVSPQTYGAVTGFHIVEHIPFNILLRMFSSIHAALDPNGFVLFETPNPENIRVGSCTFYLDPSHLKPIPPELLEFALETVGFSKIEILRLHPVKTIPESNDDLHAVLNGFYGPRDYAVIAYK